MTLPEPKHPRSGLLEGHVDALPGSRRFRWRDGERLVAFGEGLASRAGELLAEHGFEAYELISTRRALANAPGDLGGSARAVHELGPGEVPALAGGLLDRIGSRRLVALGGGRVIDVAKALAAVSGGRVAAIPTTLSGAEMTAIHRLPEGHRGALVRPALVLTDPGLLGSASEAGLRATAMNAVGHAAEALWVESASPVASLAALQAVREIATALARSEPASAPDLTSLARGGLLAGYAIDATGLSLHHVLSQSVVRTMGTPHAESNAVLLPFVVEAMGDRAPGAVAALAASLGVAPGAASPAEAAGERIRELAGAPPGLAALGGRAELIEATVAAALGRRSQLEAVSRPPEEGELTALLEAALGQAGFAGS